MEVVRKHFFPSSTEMNMEQKIVSLGISFNSYYFHVELFTNGIKLMNNLFRIVHLDLIFSCIAYDISCNYSSLMRREKLFRNIIIQIFFRSSDRLALTQAKS
jgi:hypothetical protein